jgi:hypothetical protein
MSGGPAFADARLCGIVARGHSSFSDGIRNKAIISSLWPIVQIRLNIPAAEDSENQKRWYPAYELFLRGRLRADDLNRVTIRLDDGISVANLVTPKDV